MQSHFRAQRVFPLALGVAMLMVIVGAARAPNLGAVPAQTNNQYVQRNTGGPSGLGLAVVGAISTLVIAAALALAFVLLRRRRRPPAAAAPVQPGQGGAGPGVPEPPSSATPPPVTVPAYLESPKDVGQEPPTVPATKGAEAGVGAAATEQAEPDTASLMAELDRISAEVLKRLPKKGSPPPVEPTEEEAPR